MTGANAAPESVPGLRWRKVVPGEERHLAVLRRWLESLLPPCEARGDVAAVANELASNAVRHTASGRGGLVAVEITWYRQVVRVAVADDGAPTAPHVIDDLASETGRGLLLVRGLSARLGMCGDQRGRLVWADVPWAADTAGMSPGAYEAAIRDDEAALARRFGGVPTWFGRSTLAWWAMTRAGGLVTASSAQELASLLLRLVEAPSRAPSARQAQSQAA
jgi:anti-sigma regulatory factor (Ser/Thr protein kinase)